MQRVTIPASITSVSSRFTTTLIVGILLFFGCAFCPGTAAADTAKSPLVTKDIPYASIAGFDENLTSLDIYRPDLKTGYPVLIFIHGGAWRMGDKKRYRDIGDFFAKNGCVAVTVNYRLSPEVIHPSHVKDVASAIAWVSRNIDRYGGDRSRIFVMGHSAGAHLAALVATDGRYLTAEGMAPGALAGVIPLDGAGYDIPELMADNERVYGRMYRIAFGDDPKNWADASPINHVAPGKPIPPFLMIWAGFRDEARSQARRFADALSAAGVYVETYHAQNRTHRTIVKDIGSTGDETTKRIVSFINRFSNKETP